MRAIIAWGHLAALFTAIVWGFTFISTKILLRNFSPLQILFLRFFIGWCALWLIAPKKLAIKSAKDELLFAGAGLSGVTLYFLFENVALTYTMAANVSILVTVAPFFTGLLAWLFLKTERPGINFYCGFALAITGIILISWSGARLRLNPIGDILAILAAITWAVYSIIIRKLSIKGYDTLRTTRRVFFYGILLMVPALLIQPTSLNAQALLAPENLGNLLFLGLGASALCFAIWTWAMDILGATRASAYIYLVPVVTVIAAVLILRETITPLCVAGCGLTIMGLIVAEGRIHAKSARHS